MVTGSTKGLSRQFFAGFVKADASFRSKFVDPYTQKTKDWLEKRYRQVDGKTGIYLAHQPIYGFTRGFSEPGLTFRYSCTYAIMKTLCKVRFISLLDVGGSEGYKANLVHQIFGAKVVTTDLSAEACLRAREIFGIDSVCSDIQHLPYKDEEFDVVLCSDTLEHVADCRGSLEELLRVAKNAVVVAVPHESPEEVQQNIVNQIEHGHIHYFHTGSFDLLKGRGYIVMAKKSDTTFLYSIGRLIDANSYEGNKFPEALGRIYNRCLRPVLKLAFKNQIGSLLCAALIRLNEILSLWMADYRNICFLIIKEPSCVAEDDGVRVSVRKIINTTVPFHYLEISPLS
jgi:2-polyprenyl-3-methyl-5-hydroxy-6-metoxy-1,4-benzoquinol methylase